MKRISLSLAVILAIFFLTFCQKGHTVSVTIYGNGSVNPQQIADVPTGESRTFTITPDPENSLHTIKANGIYDPTVTLANTSTTYLLTNITSDIALEVAFVASPWVKLTIEPSGTILAYADTCMVTWETNNVNSVYLNGQQMEYLTYKRMYRLFADTKFTLTGKFGDYTFEETQEVHVGDWTTSTFGLVSYYPWRYKEFRVSSVNGVIMSTIYLTEEELSWIFYYHRDGRLTYSPNLSNKTVPWYIEDKNTIVINGATYRLQVNQEEMIISYEITYNGQSAWFDMVRVHASDIPTDPD